MKKLVLRIIDMMIVTYAFSHHILEIILYYRLYIHIIEICQLKVFMNYMGTGNTETIKSMLFI